MQKTINRLKTFFNYRELFFQLVARDIKNKYRNSVLGYLWSILNPLLIMIVKILVFSNLFARGVQHFPIYLIIGYLLFHYMSSATSQSITSVTGNSGLLKKVYVPKYIFTLSTVTSELIVYFLSLIALIIVIIATKAPLSISFLLVIIPIIQIYIFCIGLGLFLAQATVFFRDVVHIWSVVTTAWMFLSAIFYPVDILPDWLKTLVIKYNPLFFYITQFRNFTLGTSDISTSEMMIRGAVAAGIMLIIGLLSFSYNKNKFILYI